MENGYPTIPQYIFEYNIPILGICYGMQILVLYENGLISSSFLQSEKKEISQIFEVENMGKQLFL